MKPLFELIPLVLFFGAYQMDGDTLSVGSWSHTLDGIFSATAVLMISTALTWLISSLLEKRNDKRLMWMTLAVARPSSSRLVGSLSGVEACPAAFAAEVVAVRLGANPPPSRATM